MSPKVKLAILTIIGVFALLIYVTLLETRVSSLLPDTTPALSPELEASVRKPKGLTSSPIMVRVSLSNPKAARIARQSDRTQVRSDIPGIPLSTDWRLNVSFTLSRQNASGKMIPVNVEASPQLLSRSEPEKNLGLVTLMAIWALSPKESERLGQGQYEISVDLRTADLFPDQYLPDTDTLSDSAFFSLVEPPGSKETAQIQEDTALFYSAQGECALTVQYARSAFRMDPQRHMAYWYAADCLVATGDTPAAIATLKQLLAVFPPEAAQNDLYVAVVDWLDELQP